MSEQTANSFFIFSPLAVKHAQLYQQLLKEVGDYRQLGNRLIGLGEQAHAVRDFGRVREIGQVLSNLPLKSYKSIGYYFLAVAANSKGNGDQAEALRLFELATDTAPAQYKAKAILSLAAVSAHTRDYKSEMYYYNETLKVSALSLASIEALRGMAIFKAREGYHGHAVKELEQLLPVIKYAPPHIRLNYLNSYAVELSEVGRLEEARNVSLIAVSSPLVRAYPEWQETYSEVNQKLHKRRSTVSVFTPKSKPKSKPKPVTSGNVSSIFRRNGLPEDSPVTPALPLRFVDPGREASDPSAGRKVLTYPGWTEKSAPSPKLLLKSPTGKESAQKGSPTRKDSTAKDDSNRLSDQVDTMGVIFNGEMPNDAIRALREIAMIAYEFRGIPGIFGQMLKAVLGIIGDEQELNK